MTIIESITMQSQQQSDGRYKIRHRHTNHLAIVSETSVKRVDGAFDVAADRALSAIQADLSDVELELQQAISDARSGLTVDRVPSFQTQVEFDRRLLGRLMMVSDVHAFHNSLPFFQAVQTRGGANSNARAAYLEITRDDYDLINARYGDTQGAAVFITDQKGQVWEDLPAVFE